MRKLPCFLGGYMETVNAAGAGLMTALRYDCEVAGLSSVPYGADYQQ